MMTSKTLRPPWKGNLFYSFRAEKHLKYFARQIYTDRLMICLIIVIIIAIIVIIILSAIGKTPNLSIDTLKWFR